MVDVLTVAPDITIEFTCSGPVNFSIQNYTNINSGRSFHKKITDGTNDEHKHRTWTGLSRCIVRILKVHGQVCERKMENY